jgi:hypothetical protein
VTPLWGDGTSNYSATGSEEDTRLSPYDLAESSFMESCLV